LGTRFDQAYPITRELLTQLLSIFGNDLHGLRNSALLLVAYESMRRRSELTSLRVEGRPDLVKLWFRALNARWWGTRLVKFRSKFAANHGQRRLGKNRYSNEICRTSLRIFTVKVESVKVKN
jgi:hypothetical protein